MHNAPSVTYPVGRSRLAGRFLAVAWLAGAAGIAAWWAQVHPSIAKTILAMTAMLAGGAFAWRGWTRSPCGSLAWNGEGWTWKSGATAEPGDPDCVLDLQHTMLLRWHAHRRAGWFWVERGGDARQWDDLRRAVYSRARSGTAHTAAPGHEARP